MLTMYFGTNKHFLIPDINRPRNSFFLEIHFVGGSKLLLPGARPGSKTNFEVAKLYVHFYAMKIY